jgi:hypothetical protein
MQVEVAEELESNCRSRWTRWRWSRISNQAVHQQLQVQLTQEVEVDLVLLNQPGPGGAAGGSGIVIVKELNKASGSWPLRAQFSAKKQGTWPQFGYDIDYLVVAGGGGGSKQILLVLDQVVVEVEVTEHLVMVQRPLQGSSLILGNGCFIRNHRSRSRSWRIRY